MNENCEICQRNPATMTLTRTYPVSDPGPVQMVRKLSIDLCSVCEQQFADAFERVTNAIKARQNFKVVP